MGILFLLPLLKSINIPKLAGLEWPAGEPRNLSAFLSKAVSFLEVSGE